MPYRKIQFVTDEIYHIAVRAIDDNIIFKDIDDHYRGIFSIYEFNNRKPVSIKERRKIRARTKRIQLARGPSSGIGAENEIVIDGRDKLVEVLAFCIMPNHLHLLVRQLKEGGIVKFMSKLNTGYGGYFNRKYGRTGYVFRDRFFAVRIENEEQLKTVIVYIHTNPISLIEPKWKERGIKDPEKCIKFLENYKWSSYLDYIGKKNFPSVTDRESILKIMNGERGCEEFVESWIKYKGEIKEFPHLVSD